MFESRYISKSAFAWFEETVKLKAEIIAVMRGNQPQTSRPVGVGLTARFEPLRYHSKHPNLALKCPCAVSLV